MTGDDPAGGTERDDDPDLPVRPGDLVGGKYRVVRLLAKGGIGLVVEAHDMVLDRPVALKFLLPAGAADPEVLARFDLEARAAVKLQSEHVARVHDVGTAGQGRRFIVLEYLHGEDLAVKIARDGPLPFGTAAEYVVQACEALAEAHALGIVHRDLKPANLFLTRRSGGFSIVKVIDFGLAKTTIYPRADDGVGLGLTRSTSFIGTPRYMAPEQLRGAKATDARTDVWGLGTILWELVAGRPPFLGETMPVLCSEILTAEAPPLRSVRPEVPEAFDAVVRRCLRKEPAERWPTTADLAAALAPFCPPRALALVERAASHCGVRPSEIAEGDDPPPPPPAGTRSDRSDAIPAPPPESEARTPGPRERESSAALVADAPPAAPAHGVGWDRLRRFAWIAGVVLVLGAATLLALRLGGGGTEPARTHNLGSPCSADRDCRGGGCVEGICAKGCVNAADCPAPTRCMRDGLCSLPLRVGFVYVGVPEDEGWTLTHDIGRRDAEAALAYLETDYVSNVFDAAEAAKAIDDFAARGMDAIVGNSLSLLEPVERKAVEYPDVRFLVPTLPKPGPANLGFYFGRMEQAWYLAGYVAAHRAPRRRLGYVGALVTPEVVRHINAFTRGARRHDPGITVEVRWLGFWFDAGRPDERGRYREEALAEELIASGCDVIAHHTDNGRVVAAVEASPVEAYSIGNDNADACRKGPRRCLGTTWWNWGPSYVRLFEALHRGAAEAVAHVVDPIRANPRDSIVNFTVNVPVAGSDVAIDAAGLLAELTRDSGSDLPFRGPYCSTGQRTGCVPAGAAPTPEEVRTMCWFVEGVVERNDPADPRSPDRPARVPQPDCTRNQ
jgi:serine/threonine protein kinase/basic membrane lipoprotein Med (substrate-binding protein (PBP1-ABC) superfamily)